MTISPALSPEPITDLSPQPRSTFTGRMETLESDGHYPYILAVWTCFHGLSRHDHSVLLDRELSLYVHELARPQPVFRICENGLQLDRSGIQIHGIVDEIQLAFLLRFATRQRDHLQRMFGVIAPDFGELLLRNGERYVNRLRLQQCNECGVVLFHQVARPDLNRSGAA